MMFAILLYHSIRFRPCNAPDRNVVYPKLQSHETTFVESISTNFAGVRVHEVPPNGQGITALLALNILEQLGIGTDPKAADLPVFNTPDSNNNNMQAAREREVEGNEGEAAYLHRLIEVLRLAFADTRWYCADPDKVDVPVEQLLSQAYAEDRAQLFDPARRAT